MSQSPSPISPMPANPKLAKLERLRKLSYIWDNSLGIPGTPLRVGLESLIGLLPVGGDIIGMIFSAYILIEAAQLGLPKVTLVRMLFNIVVDGVVGMVPILGDLFDSTWKANTKNVNLLEAHLLSPHPSRNADKSFFLLLIGGFMLILIVLSAIAFLIFKLVLQAINS